MPVQLFARAADLAGTARLMVSLRNPFTVQQLRRDLGVACPALETIQSSLLIAVDRRYAGPETVIGAKSDVACFPPVSGG
ncbi:MoaD/ThiS family protein [Planctellipticum variicoloris]|uniref:MoaD/ThiS family protein n=1 Tax=Planctellipticum variicoloris TaxID=3064265 RepID=UPI002C92F205|nr:MoaD/ThiS family protein [Planctomycetaceae bacterium]